VKDKRVVSGHGLEAHATVPGPEAALDRA